MYHAQLTRCLSKLDRQTATPMEQRQLGGRRRAASVSPASEKYRANPWHALVYQAICFSILVLLSMTWLRPDTKQQEVPDWKPVLALAEVAREKNELYVANGLYAQAGKLAARSEDWAGLLNAACGMRKLERERGPYSTTHRLLIRAMMAAQAKRSPTGLTAVAHAFTALGEHSMAAQTLARAQPDWAPDAGDSRGPDCWGAGEQDDPAGVR
jgi:hypothetical protein